MPVSFIEIEKVQRLTFASHVESILIVNSAKNSDSF